MAIWLIYIVVVLAVSGVIGMHLGRFREAYTEMTGMMAGMTMGMLNGFVLGYAVASAIGYAGAAASAMFLGNLFGILMGLALGVYFGRPGGLMGIMDGAMGGVMGGSMGAMLSVMVRFPEWALTWTAVLLSAIYIAGMIGLVVLIERSAPGHEALHRLTPFFTRAIAYEVTEAADAEDAEDEEGSRYAAARPSRPSSTVSSSQAEQGQAQERRLVDYYALLGVRTDADKDEITDAYLEKLDTVSEADSKRLERALAVLTNSEWRQTYDARLAEYKAISNSSSNGKGRGEAVSAVAASVTAPAGQATAKVSPWDGRQNGHQGPMSGRPIGGGAGAGAGGGRTRNASQNGAGARGKQGQSSGQGKGGGQRQGGNQPAQRQQVRYAQMPQQRNSPISWVGGVGVVVILLILGWWVLSAGASQAGGGSPGAGGQSRFSGAAGETQAQLDQEAVIAPVGADGKQTIDVVLNSGRFQYEPKVIKVKQGIPVHFNLSVKNGDPG